MVTNEKKEGNDTSVEYGYDLTEDIGNQNDGQLNIFDPNEEEFSPDDSSETGDDRKKNREESLAVRIRRRGVLLGRSSSTMISVGSAGFNLGSVHRTSEDWRSITRLFVADLAFRSVTSKPFQREVTFRPYTCHAAVLFVDLSGYSKITSTLASKGAHYLSSVVNAYFSKLLRVVSDNGGDVVKFAGDAFMAVWEGSEEDLRQNVMCAALCGLELQEKYPFHPVLDATGTSPELGFRIHIGVTAGILHSEVFEAPVHQNMQRLFHVVGGETMDVIGDIVDAAKPGEVGIDARCLKLLGNHVSVREIPQCDQAKILVALETNPSLLQLKDEHIDNLTSERSQARDFKICEDFIHPRVIQLLSLGGRSPTQISQMRSLCVLFIAMTSHGDPVNWLYEVQGVLDMHRCPIIQIIDDDKGVHIVAAVNLYEAFPEVSTLGLAVCSALVDGEAGCAIGMAMGTSFCGVTGSSSIACRWDITGPAVVRAARLMQFALQKSRSTAIDSSVFCDRMCSFFLQQSYGDVKIKGTGSGCNVYELKGNNTHCAFRILETMNGSAFEKPVAEIVDWICDGNRQRCAVVVKGPSLSGKKVVCQQAAGCANLVPFGHICDPTFGFLQLAGTISTWFTYVESMLVSNAARDVQELLSKKRWTKAHDACVQLLNLALEEGLSACFVIDRIQFLDEFSLSLIRVFMHHSHSGARRESGLGLGSRGSLKASGCDQSTAHCSGMNNNKICFLCVHTTFYDKTTAEEIVQMIARSNKQVQVPIIEVGLASNAELRTLLRDIGDMEIEDRWLRTFAESSGNCVGYFLERVGASRRISGKLWKQGKDGIAATTNDLVLHIPPGRIRMNRDLKVMSVSADVAMKLAHIYDCLPLPFQLVAKVLAIVTRRVSCAIPQSIIWQVVNDLITQGVDESTLSMIVKEMKAMYLLKIVESPNYKEAVDHNDGDGDIFVSFLNPALGDIAIDFCTPVQVRTIANALIDRLDPISGNDFRIQFILADLHLQLATKDYDLLKRLWYQGYHGFLREIRGKSLSDDEQEIEYWTEIIQEEIEGAGYDAREVLGRDFQPPSVIRSQAPTCIPLLKLLFAPIAFGPMGFSLALVCRNTFREHAVFYGASDEYKQDLLSSRERAADRYLKELDVVEKFLSDNGIAARTDHIEKEKDLIRFITSPAKSAEDVVKKAEKIHEEYAPLFAKPRVERLRELVNVLRNKKNGSTSPFVIQNAEKPIRAAYETLQRSYDDGTSEDDAVQHALMVMATMNWKPKLIPAELPHRHHLTLARIRNKILKRNMTCETAFSLHQSNVKDFEAFLLTTSLLYSAHESGKC